MTTRTIASRNYGVGTQTLQDVTAERLLGDRGIELRIHPATNDWNAGKSLAIDLEISKDGGQTWEPPSPWIRTNLDADALQVATSLNGGDCVYQLVLASVPDRDWHIRPTVTISGGPIRTTVTITTLNPPVPTRQNLNPFTYDPNSRSGFASASPGTSVTYTPSSPGFSAGNFLACFVAQNSNANITAMTRTGDTVNTMTAGRITQGSGPSIEARYIENCVSGTAGVAVTVASSVFVTVSVNEFSGAATTSSIAAQNASGATGASGTTATANSVTPTAVNQLLFAYCNIGAANNPAAGTDGNGNAMSGTTQTGRAAGEYREQTTTTACAPTFTWTGSTTWVIGAFVVAAGAAATTQTDFGRPFGQSGQNQMHQLLAR